MFITFTFMEIIKQSLHNVVKNDDTITFFNNHNKCIFNTTYILHWHKGLNVDIGIEQEVRKCKKRKGNVRKSRIMYAIKTSCSYSIDVHVSWAWAQVPMSCCGPTINNPLSWACKYCMEPISIDIAPVMSSNFSTGHQPPVTKIQEQKLVTTLSNLLCQIKQKQHSITVHAVGRQNCQWWVQEVVIFK